MYDYTVESFTARCLILGRELGNIFTKPGVCNYCCDFFSCFGICIKVRLYESSSIRMFKTYVAGSTSSSWIAHACRDAHTWEI